MKIAQPKIRNLIISTFTLLLMCSSSNSQKFNILIIGDSISIGYTPYVAASMNNVANIIHNDGNAQSSSNGVSNIKRWIGSTKWDIIQFNFGLWDLAYRRAGTKKLDKKDGVLTATPAEYKANLELIVQELIKTNAKLIFVKTSYVPVDELGRFVGDEDIYNAVALEVMNKYGITVNDITTESKNIHLQNGLGTNNVHYNAAGYQQLASLITAGLNKILVGMTPKNITIKAD
jgi:lysophospholipase L1-like esterase